MQFDWLDRRYSSKSAPILVDQFVEIVPEDGVRDAGVVVAHTNEASPFLH